MFTSPRANVIESDEGFSVQILGFSGMKYSEGEKVLKIHSEVLANADIVIYMYSIKHWQPPFDNETISENEKNRIVSNIERAIKFKGHNIDISH